MYIYISLSLSPYIYIYIYIYAYICTYSYIPWRPGSRRGAQAAPRAARRSLPPGSLIKKLCLSLTSIIISSSSSSSSSTPGSLIKKLHIKKLRGWIPVIKRNFLTRGGGGGWKNISQQIGNLK